MDGMEHERLTAHERDALEALPRERMPGTLLEERTVRALRERGLIRPPRRRWSGARSRTGAIAASLVLFMSGVAVGQWSARAPAAPTGEAAVPAALQSAAQVQRAGTAYVNALAVMVDAMESADAGQRAQAREVALAPLWAAANEIVRLAPADPLADRILDNFEPGRDPSSDGVAVRHVVWF